MVSLCYDAKDWDKLNETIVLLSKRRAQLKQAVTAMVQQASTYLDELAEARKLSLIETPRNVSEGKMCAPPAHAPLGPPALRIARRRPSCPPAIAPSLWLSAPAARRYVEVERARLTRILAGMQEATGDVEARAQVGAGHCEPPLLTRLCAEQAARKTMQDTVVETLGGMDKREKTDFILEQIRLRLGGGCPRAAWGPPLSPSPASPTGSVSR